MGYQFVDTQSGFSLTAYRLASTHNHIVTQSSGSNIDLTGSTFHLWVALPSPSTPVPVAPTHVTPGSGFSPSLGKVAFDFTETDLASWGLYPGTYAAELLCTNDGGVTMDKVAVFAIVVPPWITATF